MSRTWQHLEEKQQRAKIMSQTHDNNNNISQTREIFAKTRGKDMSQTWEHLEEKQRAKIMSQTHDNNIFRTWSIAKTRGKDMSRTWDGASVVYGLQIVANVPRTGRLCSHH